LRSGTSRRSEPVIQLADPSNSRLSFSNLTEAHVLDALRRQYQVELPQIRQAVNYLREHFRSAHPLVHHEMLTDGKDLFVEAAGIKDVINASRDGQLAMRDLTSRGTSTTTSRCVRICNHSGSRYARRRSRSTTPAN
jgi:hypothetical protein